MAKELADGAREARKLIPRLIATAFVVPALACAKEQAAQVPGSDSLSSDAGTEITEQAIRQETIQLVQRGSTDSVDMYIAGEPGVHFRIRYSATGEAGTYNLVPNGEGLLGEDSLGHAVLALESLGGERTYITVTTSDDSSFSETRVMREPLILNLETTFEKDGSDSTGSLSITLGGLGAEMRRRLEPRTPSAVAAVRGFSEEDPGEEEDTAE